MFDIFPLQEINEGMDGDLLADMIDEVQPAQNGMLELEEFLEVSCSNF